MLAVTGITNKSLRALMTGLLDGIGYTTNQASYDLARLRSTGSSPESPARTATVLTGNGLRFTIFYTKLHDRLLRPLLADDQPCAPQTHEKHLHTVNMRITEHIDRARLSAERSPKTQDNSERPCEPRYLGDLIEKTPSATAPRRMSHKDLGGRQPMTPNQQHLTERPPNGGRQCPRTDDNQ